MHSQVKLELKEEARFLARSEGRIKSLNERQKLIKMADVLMCLNKQKSFEALGTKERDDLIKSLEAQQKTLT